MTLIKCRCEVYRREINPFHGIIGESPSIRKLIHQIQKVAKSDAPVLLTGETGTGKELTARSIHNLSARSDGPFVAINCAALPESLVQSELFGHEKGAFTGAIQRHIGSFESASGGTIFLDEIGDMPLVLQVNLLRFLEDKVVERLGGNAKTVIDTRIIAATNERLDLAIQQGSFRKDLLYRLDVLELETPSLRERVTDIEAMANFFVSKFSIENGCHIKGFTQHALEAMTEHSWPGNVRELINRVQRALIMSEGHLITPSDLGLKVDKEVLPQTTLEESRNRAEIEAIHSALQRSHNNMSHAAHQLGISRTSLYRLMDKLHIRT